MKRIRNRTALAAVAVLSVFSTAAMAQGPRADAAQRWQKLNLTAAQQTAIQQIEQQYRSVKPSVGQQQWHTQQSQLLQGKTFNEVQARQWIQQRQQQRAEFELQQLKKQHAIFQVLNSQQQQQWLQARAERGQKAKWRGNSKGERRGPTPANMPS